MSWRNQWNAISSQIIGLMDAVQLYYTIYQTNEKYVEEINTIFEPQSNDLSEEIKSFRNDFRANLSPNALNTLNRFIGSHTRCNNLYGNRKDLSGLQLTTISFAAFRTAFSFYISDTQAVAKRITERAFIHLQRKLIVDGPHRQLWQNAFDKGETECEKLGATHLLSHGIWSFKANEQGERTDLVLGTPLKDLSIVEETSERIFGTLFFNFS